MKDISIIIPHYNGWSKLYELLMTIPDNSSIEIIVIDDSSNDALDQIPIYKKTFPNVVFLRNTSENKGAGSARNVGIKSATGKWLMFADSDDKFSDDFLTTINKYIDSHYDIVYFRPTSFVENSNAPSGRHKQYEKFVLEYLKNSSKYNDLQLRYEFVVPWSKLIRHSVVISNNIQFEEIMHSNDILFSAKVGFYANGISASDEIIYKVRESAGSLTSTVTDEKFRERFNAWTDYMSFIKEKLDKNSYKLLNLSAFPLLSKIYENNLNYYNYFFVLIKCMTNGIPIVDRRIYKPTVIFKLAKEKKQKKIKDSQ